MCDLISRQLVIKTLCERRCGDKPKGCPAGFCTVSLEVDCIPSAQPEQKMGKWIRDKKTEKEEQLIFHKIWTCSKCGEQQCRPKPSNFCPNCGADMRGEKDETD